jgi:hypothetical protein
VIDGIQNLSNLLREDPALARTELAKHCGEIRMIPQRNEAHRFYVAEGNWDLLGRDEAVGFGALRPPATISKACLMTGLCN